MGTLILSSKPTKLPIPDGRGDETLEVIQNPHRIESAQPGKVDESTIQIGRRRGREFKPGGNSWSNNTTFLSLKRATAGPTSEKERFDRKQQPTDDPDCKLGVKRSPSAPAFSLRPA